MGACLHVPAWLHAPERELQQAKVNLIGFLGGFGPVLEWIWQVSRGELDRFLLFFKGLASGGICPAVGDFARLRGKFDRF